MPPPQVFNFSWQEHFVECGLRALIFMILSWVHYFKFKLLKLLLKLLFFFSVKRQEKVPVLPLCENTRQA